MARREYETVGGMPASPAPPVFPSAIWIKQENNLKCDAQTVGIQFLQKLLTAKDVSGPPGLFLEIVAIITKALF